MKFHPELDLKLTPAIREMSFGVFQGKYSRSVHWDALEGTILTRKLPEGESVLEMAERVIGFVNKLLTEFPSKKILMVTHGGPIRVIKSAVENEPLEQLFEHEVLNVSIWRYEINKPLTLDPIP